METEKKKIFLYMFVVFILNSFFLLVINQIFLLAFITLSLVIAYFSIYPNEFFLILQDAKKHTQNYLRNYQTKHAIKDNSSVEDKRYEEKRDIEKINENRSKRDNIPLIG
ncbi:hypothetical protein [Methanocaldococcus lauensis]|uniref:hypothetical protein n=1 Tax=Methanocaldococcus lauensis TaxID=2546128 RepID=UPI001BDD67ED|nr:hypothetical protein [Methanocaldococcus lauensis]